MVTVHDERFHARSSDPYWNESAWFGFHVPEHDIGAYVYFYHRPNMKLSAGGVMVWDPSGSSEYDCLAFDWDRTQDLRDDNDMFDFALDNGLEIRCEDHFKRYRITHNGSCRTDLVWESVLDPFDIEVIGNQGLVGWADVPKKYPTGHYEQFGRVTGSITIEGTEIPVDSYSIRDHSWGPRKPSTISRGNLVWCVASDSSAFSAYSVTQQPAETDPVIGTVERVAFGHYTRDGVGSHLAGGTTEVLEWTPDGKPLRLVVDAEDQLGRTLHAEGTAVNSLIWTVYDDVYQVSCTTMWEFDGQRAAGEEWVCVPKPMARRMLRAGR